MSDENQNVKDEDSRLIAQTLSQLTTLVMTGDQRAAVIEERMMKAEVNQEAILQSIGKLTENMETMVTTVQNQAVSTTKFEQQLIAQEKRTIDSFSNQGKLVEKLGEKVDNMAGRVYLLELESAGNAGKQSVESNSRKFWSDNWFKILQTLVYIIGIAAAIMVALNNGIGGSGLNT